MPVDADVTVGGTVAATQIELHLARILPRPADVGKRDRGVAADCSAC